MLEIFSRINVTDKRDILGCRDSLIYLEWYVVVGKLLQHVVSKSINHRFPGLSRTSATVLWLNVQNCVKDWLSGLTLITENKIKNYKNRCSISISLRYNVWISYSGCWSDKWSLILVWFLNKDDVLCWVMVIFSYFILKNSKEKLKVHLT